MASVENDILAIERKVQRIIRKSVRNNETDYHVQIGVSSLDPGVVKYSLNIQQLDGTFAPITMIFKSFDELKEAAKQLETKIDRDAIEKAFVKSRIAIFEKQLEGAKKTLADLEEIGYDALVERQTKEFEAKYRKDDTEEEAEG